MFEIMHALSSPQLGQPGYEGYLNFNIISLATLMRDARSR